MFRYLDRNMTKPTGNILKIEDVKEGIYYAMTISPCDDHQYWREDDRVSKFQTYMRNYMVKKLLPNDFIFYIEVSPQGRLHLHGRLKFKNKKSIMEFYVSTIRFLVLHNQIELDTIKDEDTWNNYITKQKVYNFGIIESSYYNNLNMKDEYVFKKIPEC